MLVAEDTKLQVVVEDVRHTRDRWGKSYVQYVVTINCGGFEWQVYRRYSQFLHLRHECSRLFDRGHKIPKLPSKRIFMSEDQLQERRRGLEHFIQQLIEYPEALSFKTGKVLSFLGFLANIDDEQRNIEDIEAWNTSYVSKIPPWLYALKAIMPSQGDRVPIGLLRVKVVSAKNLPRMDYIGSSDPYVKLILGSRVQQIAQTKHIDNTLNPLWEEQFLFEVTNATSSLRVEVYDYDLVGEDDIIGYFDVALKYLAHEQTVTGDFFLKKPKNQEDKKDDEKKKGKKPEDFGKWESKDPPRVKLQLRYTFSRMGEMVSYWNPEPAVAKPPPEFEVNLLYKNLMVLLENIQPLINFFYAFYMVLLWDDPYYSAWISFCFVICCFHPWALAVFIQGWLIYYMISKYIEYKAKNGHIASSTDVGQDTKVITSAPASPEPAEYKLPMAGTLYLAIKSAGMVGDMKWYQNILGTVNWSLETLYSLFDWSSPSTSHTILTVLMVTTAYCLFFPVHYMTLVIGLYVLFMWTTPFIFVMFVISGFGRYFGRERATVGTMKKKWHNTVQSVRKAARPIPTRRSERLASLADMAEQKA